MPDWGEIFAIGVHPLELARPRHVEQVNTATMENDGQISVIRRDGASPPAPAARKRPPG